MTTIDLISYKITLKDFSYKKDFIFDVDRKYNYVLTKMITKEHWKKYGEYSSNLQLSKVNRISQLAKRWSEKTHLEN